MRSIEYLIQLYPDKTGKELLEIQNQDKIEDELEYKKFNQEKLDIIEDINKNGGYYKGRFGLNQYFYYNFTNLRLESDNNIYCDCETLVCFKDEKSDNINKIDLRPEIYERFENFGIQIYTRTTKEDFDEIKKYLSNIFTKFW